MTAGPLRAGLLLLLLGLLAGPAPGWADPGSGQPAPATAPPRAYGWVLKVFTKENWLSEIIRGNEARPVGDDRIDFVDMNITVFSGDASNQIDTILLSPAASYLLREKRASGPGEVRLIRYRDNREICEITGEDWTYEQAGKKVSIRRHVHVVYQASLSGFAP